MVYTIFSDEQLNILELEYAVTPFPDFSQLNNIARTFGMDFEKIRRWFNKRRRKARSQGNLPVRMSDVTRRKKCTVKATKTCIIYCKDQLKILEKEFVLGQKPKLKRREEIALKLGLNEKRIQVWFKNRRIRHSRKCREQDKLPDVLDDLMRSTATPDSYASMCLPSSNIGPESTSTTSHINYRKCSSSYKKQLSDVLDDLIRSTSTPEWYAEVGLPNSNIGESATTHINFETCQTTSFLESAPFSVGSMTTSYPPSSSISDQSTGLIPTTFPSGVAQPSYLSCYYPWMMPSYDSTMPQYPRDTPAAAAAAQNSMNPNYSIYPMIYSMMGTSSNPSANAPYISF